MRYYRNMPKTPVNYDNTHFYKIVCKDTKIQDAYIRHTTNFTKRKYKHKDYCSNPTTRNYNIHLYQFIRDNGGWENFDMILINTEKCENSLEARKREREYIEQLGASLNIVRPFITTDEASEQKRSNVMKIRKTIIYRRKRNIMRIINKRSWKIVKNTANKTKNEYRITKNNITKITKTT